MSVSKVIQSSVRKIEPEGERPAPVQLKGASYTESFSEEIVEETNLETKQEKPEGGRPAALSASYASSFSEEFVEETNLHLEANQETSNHS